MRSKCIWNQINRVWKQENSLHSALLVRYRLQRIHLSRALLFLATEIESIWIPREYIVIFCYHSFYSFFLFFLYFCLCIPKNKIIWRKILRKCLSYDPKSNERLKCFFCFSSTIVFFFFIMFCCCFACVFAFNTMCAHTYTVLMSSSVIFKRIEHKHICNSPNYAHTHSKISNENGFLFCFWFYGLFSAHHIFVVVSFLCMSSPILFPLVYLAHYPFPTCTNKLLPIYIFDFMHMRANIFTQFYTRESQANVVQSM